MSPAVSASAASSLAWTQPRVDRLKALLAQGLSASQIALALGGVSRNAVIGKIHRLGLAGPKPPSPPGQRATTPPRAGRRRRVPSPPPRPPGPPDGPAAGPAVVRRPRAPVAVDAVGRIADLAALPRRACRWPIGDPKDAGFSWCGAPASRAPYCQTHRTRAHRPTPALDQRRSTRPSA